MKSKIGMTLLILILLGAIYKFITNQDGVDKTFLLPNDFEGCVFINYNVEGASPLKIKDNEIIYKVPESGIIYTSSPSEFGFANKEHSGWFELNAFYVDENDEIIEKLPQEKIRSAGIVSTQEEGKPEKEYSYRIFGSKEIQDKGCSTVGLEISINGANKDSFSL